MSEYPPRRTALVLGGTGFVGGHIANTLRDNGYRTVTVSRRPTSTGATHCALDLETGDAQPLIEVLRTHEPALVVNAAGSYWGADEPQLHRSFVTATETALTALAARPDRRPRYVHLGSVMEYGPLPELGSVDESAPTEPESAYGRTKLAATELVRAAIAAGTVDGVVLRATNSIGPGVHPGSLIGKVGSALAANRDGRARIELSPLAAHRDYIDVRDLAEAVLAAARTGDTVDVVNIGRGQALSVRELVDRLVTISEVPVDIVETAAAPTAPGTSSIWLEVATETAARTLGWRVTRSIDQALHDYWRTLTH
ncbi:NAD-dependent epimerase/dehydratase family protein [Nocardia brasiliensis]|uniref:NAD-dependent epimerase/dehydratase family protein n=1 Tax=Nocardia brasiliensis TaxID=37326 RepID=UPI0004A70C2C|nr:NAD-dependent epimerase/dehydratase family protein [Nocardia brasiliensis]